MSTIALKSNVKYMFIYKKYKPLTSDELIEPGTQAYILRETELYNDLNYIGEYTGLLRYYSREPYSGEERIPSSELIKIVFSFETDRDSVIVENINQIIFKYYPSFYLSELRVEGLVYHYGEPEEGGGLLPEEGREKYWWELFPWLPSLGFPKDKRMEEVITDLVIIAIVITLIVILVLFKLRR